MGKLTYFLAVLILIAIIFINIFDMNLPYKLDHWLNILFAILLIGIGFYNNRKKSNFNK